ncbi:hypothetical protein HDV03_005133 [Kappamyces sp. JEL0829]|nr:hypothetical protein HDV03_005133 [Kappamyces sp. JEL0829]
MEKPLTLYAIQRTSKETQQDLKRHGSYLTSLLPRDEQQKLAKYYHERDRHASLLGQVLARYSILAASQVAGQASASAVSTHAVQTEPLDGTKPLTISDVVLERSARGRPVCSPALAAVCPLDFNVSHHGEFVVCALSALPGSRVGIDITQIAPSLPPLEAFAGVFNPYVEEAWILAGLSEWERSKRFSILWALKEAYVKCTGEGITIDLTLIVFHMTLCDSSAAATATNKAACWDDAGSDWLVELRVDGTLLQQWTLCAWMLDREHVVALAVDQASVAVPAVVWPSVSHHILPLFSPGARQ